jgi:pimeloyl-ACP methyl ester carboxylesterase
MDSTAPAAIGTPVPGHEGVRRVHANGIDLAYETFGDPAADPIVLVMGLGTQMIAWPEDFCQDLAARGHYVVRFDNRDVGLSTHLDDADIPKLREIVLRRNLQYTLDDLAADLLGLLDVLGLSRVHLVGASLGGYICQTAVLAAPDRFASLTLIMTSTGSRRVGQARPGLVKRLLTRPEVTHREDAIAAVLETFRFIGSPGYPLDDEHLRDLAGRSWDRGYDRAGYRRQLAAASAQPNRTRQLAKITVPTLVVHGLHDPLVAPSGGVALAKAIPHAKLVGFSGMGHNLPPELRPQLADEIAALARRAKAGARPA